MGCDSSLSIPLVEVPYPIYTHGGKNMIIMNGQCILLVGLTNPAIEYAKNNSILQDSKLIVVVLCCG